MTNGNGKQFNAKDVVLAVMLYVSLVLTGAALGVSFVSREFSTEYDVGDFTTALASKPTQQCGQPVIYERDANDLFFIMVSLNGNMLPMLVDTGATNSSLPHNLSYAFRDSLDGETGYIPIETANGFVSAEVFSSQDLMINGRQLKVDMLLLQNHADSGILGLDVLNNFEMVFSGRALKLTSHCLG